MLTAFQEELCCLSQSVSARPMRTHIFNMYDVDLVLNTPFRGQTPLRGCDSLFYLCYGSFGILVLIPPVNYSIELEFVRGSGF